MLDSIRVIMVLEATGSKELLANYLKSQIEHITHVDTMVDALSTVKRQRFDVAILSNDLEDYYSIENMIKILNDIGSIDDILLVSEKELPPPILLRYPWKTQWKPMYVFFVSWRNSRCIRERNH